MMSG